MCSYPHSAFAIREHFCISIKVLLCFSLQLMEQTNVSLSQVLLKALEIGKICRFLGQGSIHFIIHCMLITPNRPIVKVRIHSTQSISVNLHCTHLTQHPPEPNSLVTKLLFGNIHAKLPSCYLATSLQFQLLLEITERLLSLP